MTERPLLVQGAAWKLDVDAVVTNTNEALTDRHGINQDIFHVAGGEVGQSQARPREGRHPQEGP
jgi:hypothetical protein